MDKIGADFHRLGLRASLKSPYRSMPFMEAPLCALALALTGDKAYAPVGDLYWDGVRSALNLLPGGDCSTAHDVSQGIFEMR